MRGYVKCLWYCQRGTRGFWRGVCDFSSVVLDATGTVVGSAGMVFEAMGGSQGWPGCRRGYRRDCPGYYTPEKVYILYTARVTAEGPGGGIGTAALVLYATPLQCESYKVQQKLPEWYKMAQ